MPQRRLTVALLLLSPGVARASVYVGATPYPTIADAVNAASSGDVLSLDPGVYSEPVDLAGKDLQVLGGGASAADVVISWDGPAGNDAVVQATGAGSTTIAGVTISSAVNRAIWSTAGSLALADVVLSSDLAAGADPSGGCVRFAGGALDVTDSLLTGCSAPGDGGAVAATSGVVSAARSVFCGNVAGANGGAIYATGAFVFVDGSTFASNQSAVFGGAIRSGSGGIALFNSDFLSNSAPAGSSLYSASAAAAPVFDNNLVAFQQNGLAVQFAGLVVAPKYSSFFSNTGDSQAALDGTNLVGQDPQLIRFSDDGDCSDDLLHLQPGSPLVDAGDPAILDPDGSTSDIGAFGGASRSPFEFADADGDGFIAVYECDDTASNVFFGAPEHCDGADEDCDLLVDESPVDPTDWYADTDGDGFGDPSDLVASACVAPQDTVADATDCEPSDGTAFPGGVETCAPPDGNCDGDPVAGAVDAFDTWPDLDGDGFGDDLASPVAGCSVGPGRSLAPGDCDDGEALAFDGNPEVCFDLVDNDCSGSADGADAVDATIWYFDGDFDGVGDDATAVAACDRPPGYVAVGGDCDDAAGNDFPGNAEQCDFLDNDCDGVADDGLPLFTLYPDLDGDGHGDPAFPYVTCQSIVTLYVLDDTDCNDAEPLAFTGNPEVCFDGVDNDCSGTTDGSDAADVSLWWPDADLDGFGIASGAVGACAQPAGFAAANTDCDDGNELVFPGAVDICNGVDDDCANGADDGLPTFPFFADVDGDGHGDPGAPLMACGPLPGIAPLADDCNDGEALAWTGAIEVCDGVDNDCDGSIDGVGAAGATTWFADADGDGHGDASNATVACVQPPDTVTTADDCDDGEPLAWTGNPEVCDGADNDCNGSIDGADATDASTFYADIDGDGHGDPSAIVIACDQPADTVADDATDCDDGEPLAWTGNPEVCDGVDNDCSGNADGADAAGATTWYFDGDGDGYGGLQPSVKACDAPDRYVDNSDDCDDDDASHHPGASSVPDNEIDEDCDGLDPTTPSDDKPGCGCEIPGTPRAAVAPLALALLALRRRRYR